MYEARTLGAEFKTQCRGFVVVRLVAAKPKRQVTADVMVNGETVASASAADNYVEGVISSPTQSITIPVPRDATVLVKRASGDADVEARWLSA